MHDPLKTLRTTLADRYEIGGEVGRGGMAVVYEGLDLETGGKVAIKVIRPEYAGAMAETRFHREIRLARTLNHPNVLPLLDSGDAGDFTYYVMPLIEGESLEERLEREGSLSVENAVSIVSQVADGLAYAHDRDVLHRDVKPGNILLEDGRAVLSDFGVARALDVASGGTLTTSGVILGTPVYMSPEQGAGETDLDSRSDVYSLGCVLFEALAGEPPFSAPTAQAVIAKHIREQVPSIEVVRPDIPPPVAYTVHRALAKTRADRFSTISELRAALLAETAPSDWRGREGARASRRRVGPLIAVAIATILGLWWDPFGWMEPSVALDENLVAIFPFVQIGESDLPEEMGDVLALGISSELERGNPLRPLDGYNWLDAEERKDPEQVTAAKADSIGRAQGARYRVSGSVVTRAGQATVTLTLFDMRLGRQIDRHSERAPVNTEEVLQAGYRAINALLPTLLGADRPFEARSLQERSPAAAALFTFGNREYRSSRFESALTFYEQALAEDSLLVQAALRGADAASWLDRVDQAQTLVAKALRRPEFLAEWERDFAHGLDHYLKGTADSAVTRLERVTRGHPQRADGWFLLGEVHRHLLPRTPESRRLSLEAYQASLGADPEFTPSLFHLVEYALWDGNLDTADSLFRRFTEAGAQENRVRQLELMLTCAKGAVESDFWIQAAETTPGTVLDAAYSLMPSREYAGCAKAGYAAVMATESARRILRIDGALGLQSMLLAEGKEDSLKAVLQAAIDSGISYAYGFYVVDAMAGGGTHQEAEDFLARLSTDLSSLGPQTLWLMGQWASFRGDRAKVDTIASLLETAAREREGLAREAGDPDENLARRRRLFAGAMEAHRAALRGEHQQALKLLAGLRPTATRPNIAWSLWESLAFERLLEAELLLEAGRYEEAEAIAAELDHPAPVIYRALSTRNLELRARIAEARGDSPAADRYRSRLPKNTRQGGIS